MYLEVKILFTDNPNFFGVQVIQKLRERHELLLRLFFLRLRLCKEELVDVDKQFLQNQKFSIAYFIKVEHDELFVFLESSIPILKNYQYFYS